MCVRERDRERLKTRKRWHFKLGEVKDIKTIEDSLSTQGPKNLVWQL